MQKWSALQPVQKPWTCRNQIMAYQDGFMVFGHHRRPSIIFICLHAHKKTKHCGKYGCHYENKLKTRQSPCRANSNLQSANLLEKKKKTIQPTRHVSWRTCEPSCLVACRSTLHPSHTISCSIVSCVFQFLLSPARRQLSWTSGNLIVWFLLPLSLGQDGLSPVQEACLIVV